ncbi:hypothetical protein [Enterovibrio norvegicus]|uniref:hypothetical protein n=1 Tax=Enterovibrio norvegicus TaxID=188144 RepID=UPI0013D60E10|nr:hypothetical protein [Enterovibrio norvegicus]
MTNPIATKAKQAQAEYQHPIQIDYQACRYLPMSHFFESGLTLADKGLFDWIWHEWRMIVFHCPTTNPEKDVFSYFKSYSTLGAMLGVDRRTIGACMKRLENAGYLFTITRFDKSKIILPVHPADRLASPIVATIYAEYRAARETRTTSQVNSKLERRADFQAQRRGLQRPEKEITPEPTPQLPHPDVEKFNSYLVTHKKTPAVYGYDPETRTLFLEPESMAVIEDGWHKEFFDKHGATIINVDEWMNSECKEEV